MMQRCFSRGVAALAALVCSFAAPSSALAAIQDEEAPAEEALEEEEEEEDGDEGPRWFAIVGADVYPGDGGVLRGATILAKNGKIQEIGYDLFLPEGTERLDARGLRAYPGMVALSATTRITRGLFGEPQASDPGEDGVGDFDELHPDHLRPAEPRSGFPGHVDTGDELGEPAAMGGEKADIEDSFDPFSEFLVLALATGITTAEQSDAAVKLKRGELEGVLLREKYLTTIPWSQRNPASIRSAKEKFAEAAAYLRKLREWEDAGDKDAPEPSKKGVDVNMLRILRGERLARFNNDERQDLIGIAHLAQRHGFRPVVFGCREGWTVADELGRAGAFAVVTARENRPKEEELVRPGGSSIENAAKLHAAGVQVAIVPGNTSFDLGGITGQDLLHLPVEAAFAVRGGLPEAAAWEALTIVPARILGVEHRVGTLEPGKDLDAILTDGDVLHYQTFVQYAVVEGKLVYDKQEEIFYAHIRPRPEPTPALDPGEAPPTEEAAGEEQVEEEATEDEAEEDEAQEDEDPGAGEDGEGGRAGR